MFSGDLKKFFNSWFERRQGYHTGIDQEHLIDLPFRKMTNRYLGHFLNCVIYVLRARDCHFMGDPKPFPSQKPGATAAQGDKRNGFGVTRLFHELIERVENVYVV